MTNILLHGYYYRYREQRKQIKSLVDAANYTEARNKLNEVIAEHNTKYSNELLEQKRDFNFGEKIMMQHAKNHLNAVIDENDPSFIDGSGNIKHQSDIVKESLERIPKSDYSET